MNIARNGDHALIIDLDSLDDVVDLHAQIQALDLPQVRELVPGSPNHHCSPRSAHRISGRYSSNFGNIGGGRGVDKRPAHSNGDYSHALRRP